MSQQAHHLVHLLDEAKDGETLAPMTAYQACCMAMAKFAQEKRDMEKSMGIVERVRSFAVAWFACNASE